MSRVDKGGRSFRPLARTRPLSQLASSAPQALQNSSQADPLSIPSSTPPSCQPTSSVHHPPISPEQPPCQSAQPPLFIPEASSPPLFIPENSPLPSAAKVNPPVFIPENDQPINTSSRPNQTPQTPTSASTHHVQPPSKLSAAAKMKLKAQEAKAARASERLRKPSKSPCIPCIHASQLGDIPVPVSASTANRDTETYIQRSPPIDPLLAIAAFDNVTTHTKTITLVGEDILVSNNPSNYALLASSPSGSSTFQSAPPKLKSKRPPTKTVPGPSHSNETNQEGSSPRLKRKKHLEELRGKKKIQPQTQDEDTDHLDTGNVKCASRYKRRKSVKNKTKQKQTRKNKKVTGLSDSPIDPSKVAMAELTNPHYRKGQSSQILEARLKLIIERRAREKNEHLASRRESKKLALQFLRDRYQSVRLRKNQEQDNRLENQKDSIEDLAETQDSNENDNKIDNQQDDSRNADPPATNEKESRTKLMKEYGLEGLDYDSDMKDLEQVFFDEFANTKKRGQRKTIGEGKKANKSAQPTQNINGNEEEEEEFTDENFEEVDNVPQASQYAPQLRVVDGQIVLDQHYLEVDPRDQSPESDDMEVVEESDSARLVNSHTWSKAIRGEKWSADETSLFYDALRLFGSDFEMITQLFPGRTRRQVRAKWNREEKRSPQEITDALMGKKKAPRNVNSSFTPIEEQEQESEAEIPSHLESFDQYAKIVGIDCLGPVPVDSLKRYREKERLECDSNASLSKAKKTHGSNEHNHGNSDAEDGEEVEENFTGWGEVDN